MYLSFSQKGQIFCILLIVKIFRYLWKKNSKQTGKKILSYFELIYRGAGCFAESNDWYQLSNLKTY